MALKSFGFLGIFFLFTFSIFPLYPSFCGLTRSPPRSAISRPMVHTEGHDRLSVSVYFLSSGYIFSFPRFFLCSLIRRSSVRMRVSHTCLLYTSDAADDLLC